MFVFWQQLSPVKSSDFKTDLTFWDWWRFEVVIAKKQTVAFFCGHGVYHWHTLREMAYILSMCTFLPWIYWIFRTRVFYFLSRYFIHIAWRHWLTFYLLNYFSKYSFWWWWWRTKLQIWLLALLSLKYLPQKMLKGNFSFETDA